jgi:hypothetical protein
MEPHEFAKLVAEGKLLDLSDQKILSCDDAQRRTIARAKAEHDLKCPSFVEMLTDFHQELLPRTDRTTEDNVLHANKRLASFTARAAYESDKLSRSALRLSYIALLISIGLGVVQLLIAMLQLCSS